MKALLRCGLFVIAIYTALDGILFLALGYSTVSMRTQVSCSISIQPSSRPRALTL